MQTEIQLTASFNYVVGAIRVDRYLEAAAFPFDGNGELISLVLDMIVGLKLKLWLQICTKLAINHEDFSKDAVIYCGSFQLRAI